MPTPSRASSVISDPCTPVKPSDLTTDYQLRKKPTALFRAIKKCVNLYLCLILLCVVLIYLITTDLREQQFVHSNVVFFVVTQVLLNIALVITTGHS